MGDDMVLRAGVKGKNPIGHPPAMLGSLLPASAGFGFSAPCENYEISEFSKNFSKGIPPDPMIRGMDLGCYFLKADRPDVFPGRPLLTSIAMRRGLPEASASSISSGYSFNPKSGSWVLKRG